MIPRERGTTHRIKIFAKNEWKYTHSVVYLLGTYRYQQQHRKNRKNGGLSVRPGV